MWKRQQIGAGRTQRTCGSVIIEISRLRGVENVVRQCGNFEFDALNNWEPMHHMSTCSNSRNNLNILSVFLRIPNDQSNKL